jgi:hypothetical protein
MKTHQKEIVSLGEATQDPQVLNGLQENYRLNRPKIYNVRVSKES